MSARRFGHRFELPLLIQSVLMSLAMFALIHICVKINAKDSLARSEDRMFTGECILAPKKRENPAVL